MPSTTASIQRASSTTGSPSSPAADLLERQVRRARGSHARPLARRCGRPPGRPTSAKRRPGTGPPATCVSCSARTSGRCFSTNSSTRGMRTLSELTFQVTIFMRAAPLGGRRLYRYQRCRRTAPPSRRRDAVARGLRERRASGRPADWAPAHAMLKIAKAKPWSRPDRLRAVRDQRHPRDPERSVGRAWQHDQHGQQPRRAGQRHRIVSTVAALSPKRATQTLPRRSATGPATG